MTDRELLELAAKAAGVVVYSWSGPDAEGDWQDVPWTSHGWWNPLTDDGDALRLAVKLNMGISIPAHKTIRADVVVFTDSTVNVRELSGDQCTATRRAIVRAAAEIGKEMK